MPVWTKVEHHAVLGVPKAVPVVMHLADTDEAVVLREDYVRGSALSIVGPTSRRRNGEFRD